MKPMLRHTAGTCCTAHSAQGKRLRQKDITILFQLAWMAMRLDLQESEVIQENVESFPVKELLERFLGSTYYIDMEILDPLFYGFPISRRRLYVKLPLASNYTYTFTVYSLYRLYSLQLHKTSYHCSCSGQQHGPICPNRWAGWSVDEVDESYGHTLAALFISPSVMNLINNESSASSAKSFVIV